MKTTQSITTLCLLLTAALSAHAATGALEIKPFDIPAEVKMPADFQDALKTDLVQELKKVKLFDQVWLAGDKTDGTPALRLTGNVGEFKKGSRAARYMVPGMGKTEIKAHIQFLDAASGDVKFEADVTGAMSFGVMGGDSKAAADNLAKAIAKEAKKHF